MLKLIVKYYSHFCFGVFTILAGIYVSLHLGYLDDPRVTPPPPVPDFEHSAFQFADDWWFAVLMIISGSILLVGVLWNKRGWRNAGLVLIAPQYGALAVVFMVRGLLDMRFNLTWVFVGLAMALLIGTAMRGDRRDV